MTDYLHATHGDPSASQVRKKGRKLNTIIEEEIEDSSPRRARKHGAAEVKIEKWLSPMADHFPTPRGFHFMAAPILPSSPSAASADESASSHSSSPDASDRWRRMSSMSDGTEFDDIYDVSENEEDRRKSKKLARGPREKHDSGSPSGSSQGSRGSLASLPPLMIPPKRDTSNNEAWSGHGDFKCKIISPVPPTPPSGVALSPAMLEFMNAQQLLALPTISAPPSLDGSLSSDQLAQLSAPPTPIIGSKDVEEEDWSGVQLQPGALATLQSLSTVSTPTSDADFVEHVIELPTNSEPPREEMAERRRPAVADVCQPSGQRGQGRVPERQVLPRTRTRPARCWRHRAKHGASS